MLLRILGSGTCVPSLERNSPSNYLKIKEKHILIDCGSGALRQLEKSGSSYKEIDYVFISHFHPDHISDLNPLIQALVWTLGFERKKDLVLVGLVGLKGFYESYIRPISGDPEPNTFNVIVKEIDSRTDFGDFIVESYSTNHNKESTAYKFIENGKTLVISGDTGFDEGLIGFSKECDVLVLECSFPDGTETKTHMTPEGCGKVAEKANVGKLVLTHLYPTPPAEEKLTNTKKHFKNTILDEDLIEIKI